MRFRERPHEIDAVQWSGSNWHSVRDFAEKTAGIDSVFVSGSALLVNEANGDTTHVPHDSWLIFAPADFDGLKVMSDAAFKTHYEPVVG